MAWTVDQTCREEFDGPGPFLAAVGICMHAYIYMNTLDIYVCVCVFVIALFRYFLSSDMIDVEFYRSSNCIGAVEMLGRPAQVRTSVSRILPCPVMPRGSVRHAV